MSKRIVTAVAILGAAGVISGCIFEQPSAGCVVQDATDAPWQAVYTLKNSADASKSCGQLKGEAIGVFKYVNPFPDRHPDVPASRLGIRPNGTASRFAYSYEYVVKNADGTPKVDKDGKPVMDTKTVPRVDLESMSAEESIKVQQAASSLSATIAEEPDPDTGLCKATGFAPATISAGPAIHHESGEQLVPAESITYRFEEVSVYSAPSAPGTILKGSMVYSDGPGCQAEYQMLALWPQVACDPDAFANPTEENKADRCDAGSGVNPDFDVVCVAGIGPVDDEGNVQGGCVPNPAADKFPSFRPGVTK